MSSRGPLIRGRAQENWLVAAVFAAPCVVALVMLPFLTLRANRIVSGDPVYLWQLDGAGTLVLVACAVLPVALSAPALRMAVSVAGLALLLFMAGHGAQELSGDLGEFGRISLGGGFWLALGLFALAAVDGLNRFGPRPFWRLVLLALTAGVLGAALSSGWVDDLSLMQEYRANDDVFAAAFRGHLVLVLGSLVPALVIGLPLGRLCYMSAHVRRACLPVLNTLQTTPSIAMFGLLMIPLAALVAAVPELRAFGIAGIGATPAIIALTLYSLLPIVANTIAGLDSVPGHCREAGRAMGMSPRALLLQVEVPLAAPIILTGVRIVVVQNIGLAAVAALIGGGGYGTLIFRGMGQTAMDLVLLGTLPIVLMAMTGTVLFDAIIESLRGRRP